MTVLEAPKTLAAPELAHATGPLQPQRTFRQKLRSLFVVALALYTVLIATLSFTSPIKFDPYKFSYKGWAWWIMNDLRQSKTMHNVAMLGSSLTVSAVAGTDATYLNRKIDLTQYHGVSYLDAVLHNTFGGTYDSFNLSAPGQMPSDAFLSLKAMVQTANRPDVVIYGIAPRDFIDSTLSGPNDTEPFKYLTRVVNIDDVMNAEFRSLWSKLDWALQKIDYFYNYSLDFRLLVSETTEQLLNRYLPAPPTKTPFTWWDRQRILPNYCPAEIHPAAVIAGPLTEAEISFKDNTSEYRQRYKKPDSETYKTQMYFLRKLAEYCHRERIHLVLVNMPITFQNAAMMPPGIYSKYLEDIRKFAWNHDVSYYDLCQFGNYEREDFHDTVHLNAFGGKKFFDSLIAHMKTDPSASMAVSLSGFTMEKQLALASKYHTTF